MLRKLLRKKIQEVKDDIEHLKSLPVHEEMQEMLNEKEREYNEEKYGYHLTNKELIEEIDNNKRYGTGFTNNFIKEDEGKRKIYIWIDGDYGVVRNPPMWGYGYGWHFALMYYLDEHDEGKNTFNIEELTKRRIVKSVKILKQKWNYSSQEIDNDIRRIYVTIQPIQS